MRTYGIAVAAALAGCGLIGAAPATAQHAGPGHSMVTPGDLRWADLPSLPPGAKIAIIEGPMSQAVPFTARLRLPAGYTIPPHTHSAIEHVTVLSGVFHMGAGSRFDRFDLNRDGKLTADELESFGLRLRGTPATPPPGR